MTIHPLRRLVTASRSEILRYVAVLLLIGTVSVAVGAFTHPTIGIAAFGALGKFVLPKRAPFWRRRRM